MQYEIKVEGHPSLTLNVAEFHALLNALEATPFPPLPKDGGHLKIKCQIKELVEA